jgi:hypothetical protein
MRKPVSPALSPKQSITSLHPLLTSPHLLKQRNTSRNICAPATQCYCPFCSSAMSADLLNAIACTSVHVLQLDTFGRSDVSSSASGECVSLVFLTSIATSKSSTLSQRVCSACDTRTRIHWCLGSIQQQQHRSFQALVADPSAAPCAHIVAMCYISTPYHTTCGCYGKPLLQDGGCIRATSQAGLKAGCADKIDMGLFNVDTICEKCIKGRTESFDSGYASASRSGSSASSQKVEELRSTSSASSHLETPALNSGSHARTTSTTTTSSTSTTSTSRRLSTADHARRLLSFLPKSIPTITRNHSGVNLGVAKKDAASTAMNLHWRAFDGRGFVEDGEKWP